MKQYTISIPDDKNEFFVELIKSLGFTIYQAGDLTLEDAKVAEWQLDIVQQRIKNATDKSSKKWDDVKDNFMLE